MKFYIKRLWYPPEPIAKLLLVMKLTILLITAAILQLSAKSFAQKLTLNTANTPLKTVFAEIKKQTGLTVFYSSSDLKNTKPVTANITQQPLEEAMKTILQGQDLEFSINENTIVIRKKTPSSLDNIIARINAIDVRGTVVDSLGNPLPGAAVKIKGGTKSTSTDNSGKFLLQDVSDDAIITISYIGYITREIKAKADLGNITLSVADNKLEDVNIQYSTGYQTLPKERATGAFSYVSKEKLDSRISTNIIDKLDGLASGLVFNKDVNGNRKLSVRGKNSISDVRINRGAVTSSDPLIILDNFPYDGDLGNINPNDVEDITILKDAGAASIWGARSGNGVIVITTKKGKRNQPLSIDFIANVTTMGKPDLDYNKNFLGASDFISIQQELYNRGTYNNLLTDALKQYLPVPKAVEIMGNSSLSAAQKAIELNALKQIDVRDDLRKYFYREATNQQYNLAMRGGTDKSVYSVSIGYNKNLDNQVGNGQDRWTVNTNLNFTPLKGLELGGTMSFVQNVTTANNALSEFLYGSGSFYPYTSLVDENGNALRVQKDFNNSFINNVIPGKGFLDWTYKPVDELRNGYNTGTNKINDYRFAPSLKYTFIKGLSASLNYQWEIQQTKGMTLLTAEAYQARDTRNRYATVNNGIVSSLNTIPEGGIMNQIAYSMASQSGRLQINYDHSWTNHAVNLLVGFEAREVKTTEDGEPRLYGYDAERALTSSVLNYTQGFNLYPYGFALIPQNIYFYNFNDRTRSIFFNGAYTLRNKYTLSASARSDAANIFGVKTNQKNVPLWSLGAKWDLDKEEFYKLSWMPSLKLRATYGYTGNLPRGTTAYTTTMLSQYVGFLGTPVKTQDINSFGNERLRWEKIGKANLGLDFGMFANRINGSIEYFYKRGKDMLGITELPTITGTSSIVGNFSDMTGHGVDIRLNTENTTGIIKWTSDLLFSIARDKVTKFYDNEQSRPSVGLVTPPIMEGYPVDAIYSMPSAGLDPVTGDPRGYLKGQISKSYGELYANSSFKEDLIDGLWKYSGSAVPIYFGAFRNTIGYQNFAVSFNISYKLGYYFRRSSINYSSLYVGALGHKDYLLRWQKPGDELTTVVPSFPLTNNQTRDRFYSLSEDLIERGDHIRFQDINLSYTLNKSTNKRLPVKTLKLFVYVNNIGILWRKNKQGIDPDYLLGSSYINPNPRSYALGLQTSF